MVFADGEQAVAAGIEGEIGIAERAIGRDRVTRPIRDDAVTLANSLAPEHLELLVAAPATLLPRVRHAGAVFLGAHTPEVVGD